MTKLESAGQDCKSIATDIGLIVRNPDKFNRIVKRLTLDEWRDFVGHYLDGVTQGKILNDELIGQKMEEFDKLRPFSNHFKGGKEYCAILMPCDLEGNSLDKGDQENGDYITFLEIPSEEDLNRGTGAGFKLLRDFMPPEIARDCSFTVGDYEISPDGDDDSAHKIRAAVLAKSAQSLIRLREHLKGNPGPQN